MLKSNIKGSADHTSQIYKKYYMDKGVDRNNLLRNPEVLFQSLALDEAVVNAIRTTNIDPEASKVLDIGCGEGGSLLHFLKVGFNPEQIYGIDLLEERLSRARSRFPTMHLEVMDASKMVYEDCFFDLIFESTVFLQMTDDGLAQNIAGEMIRVLKPGGFILLADWRYSKPGSDEYLGVSRKRITKLFRLKKSCQLVDSFNGPLIPPVGRFISKRIPSVYFLVRSLFPFLVGLQVTILQKIPD